MDFFGAAPVAPTTVVKKAKKEKDTVEMGEEFDALSTIDYLIKALEGAKKTIEVGVKGGMLDKFLEIGASTGKRPESFNGVGVLETPVGDKISSGVCMLNKRSSRSPLTEEEQTLLTRFGISIEDNTISAAVEAHFRFNPEYLGNQEVMTKLNVALSGAKGLPADIIQRVPAQEGVVTKVTTEGTLDEIFALKDAAARATLVKLASTLAIKPTSKVASLVEAFKILSDLGLDELLAEEAPKKKSSK